VWATSVALRSETISKSEILLAITYLKCMHSCTGVDMDEGEGEQDEGGVVTREGGEVGGTGKREPSLHLRQGWQLTETCS
jgi:hypothetical protein